MPAWPHDDTNSLTAFYGPPGTPSNMVLVVPPWQMTYEGRPIRGVQVHRKCAASLKAVFDDIALQVGHDWSRLPPGAVKFSGSYNYRPVRGSSRFSCHAFGAAIDMDAEANPMNTNGDKGTMSPIVINAFKRQGWYWGGDFHSRQDPMHFQAANEDSRVAELGNVLDPVTSAQAAEMPPMTDGEGGGEGDNLAQEALKPQATIEELPPGPARLPFDEADQHEYAEEAARDVPPSAINQAKSLFKSKIAWLTGGLGGSAATNAVANDPQAQSLLWKLAHNTTIWLVVAVVGLAGYIVYCRWHDHGRGSIR